MSEVDHETIVTPGDGGADDGSTESDVISDDGAAGAYADLAPQSFWLSKDAEYDWFDRHAVYERSESTKVYSMHSANLHSIAHPHSNPNSQRFSGHLISKAAIIGLPKTQKITYMDSKRMTCNKTGHTRLFPKKRTICPERAAVQLAEPGSPKVSCMGRVRSKRGRRRTNSTKRREKLTERSREKLTEKSREKLTEKSRSGRDQKQKQKQKNGFYSRVMSMFRSKKGHRKLSSRSGSRKAAEIHGTETAAVGPKWKNRSLSAREIPVSGETVYAPPGLGGVKRFASGRRSDSWIT